MTLGGWIVVVIAVVVMAALILRDSSLDRNYKKTARAYAEANGWTYRAIDEEFGQRYPQLPSTNLRPLSNTDVIESEHRGRRLVSYRYTLSKWRGKSKVTLDFVVAAAQLTRALDPRSFELPDDIAGEIERHVPKATWHVSGSWLYLQDVVTAKADPSVYVGLLSDLVDALDDESRGGETL